MKMNRVLVVVATVALLGLSAMSVQAQDMSKITLFGGYSALDSGFGTDFYGRQTLQGYTLQGTANLNDHVGITADFSGHNGSEVISNCTDCTPGKQLQDVYFFTFGPTLTQNVGKVNIFAHFLAGGVHSHVSCTDCEDPTNTAFAAIVGGGVDYNASRHWGLRLIQMDFAFAHATQYCTGCYSYQYSANNLRVSAGITFHP